MKRTERIFLTADYADGADGLVRDRPYFSGKLLQEADVVLVKVADVIDAVEQHREPFETHAESITRPDFRIITDPGKNRGVNHAAATDFNPLLLNFWQMFRAQIDFEAGFGVAEIMRAETRLGIFAQKRFEDVIQQGLEVAHRDVFVDVQTFELMEISRVRRIGGIAQL